MSHNDSTHSEVKGFVQTVNGVVSPDTLGPTLAHEHLIIDFTFMLRPLTGTDTISDHAYESISLQNLGWINYDYYSNLHNLTLVDEETAINEALLFRRAGGKTIVEATTHGIGRNPRALMRIADATGLNIVMGAGFYVDKVHPKDISLRSELDITKQIVDEITVGVDNTSIKAGIIGEIGCSWPLTPNEKKVLKSAATAQKHTGAAILIHPGRNEHAPNEILEILSNADANLNKVIVGHLDRTIFDIELLLDLASTGCFMEYDLFGLESSYYPMSDIDLPNDAKRIDYIKLLFDKGYGRNIVISHDICTKHRLVKYGGHGYAHILDRCIPRMRLKGLPEEAIEDITINNPARVLAFT